MRDGLHVKESAKCELVRNKASDGACDILDPKGRFVVEHWREGRLIGKYGAPNLITNEGKNKMLDVMFHAATQITTWYLLLIDGAGSPTPAVGDTYAQINGSNGWDEFTSYDEAIRQEWTEGSAVTQSITNASPVVFTISATGDVYGIALVGGGSAASTKNDAAGGGTLWNGAAFASGTVAVLDNDQLKVTYTVSA
jgi:hypothetical protein